MNASTKRSGAGLRATAAFAHRLVRADAGIAAVEFALILPLMLMIYFGLVQFSRGLRASQRLDLVAHTLADLTAQKLDGGTNSGQAGMANADFSGIFETANTLMGLSSTSTDVKMTISEVEITSPSAGTWQAKTQWTVVKNSGTARPCTVLTASNAAPISSSTMPTSYTTVTGGVNPVTGSVIVADVKYTYSPGVNFARNKWSTGVSFTMQRTSYAAVRNTYTPNHIQYSGTITGGTNCNATP